MNNYLKKIGMLLMFLGMSSTIFFSSCKKEEDPGVAPDIPPEGAFVMDYDNFNKETKGADDTKSAWNFAAAWLHVGVWNTILTVGLVVPVASYVEALKHEPVHHSGTTWLWEYDVAVGFSTYTAQLYGTVDSDKVTWEMFVSKQGDSDFQEFKWYEGESNLSRTEGQWTLYKSNADPTAYLQIDWTKNAEDSTGTIKYTNIIPEGIENGGYISYGNGEAGELDAFYDIYNKGEDKLVEIEWNTVLHNGHIRSEHIYQDLDWNCWGTDYQDTDCGSSTK